MLIRELHTDIPTETIMRDYERRCHDVFQDVEKPDCVPVIIPALHEADTLPRCLAALGMQSLPDTVALAPVVVVDAGTDDATIDAADRMGATILETDTRGQLRAVQHGLKKSLIGLDKQTVLLTGADTLPGTGWAERLHRVADAKLTNNIGGVACGVTLFHQYNAHITRSIVHSGLAVTRNVLAAACGGMIPRGNNMLLRVSDASLAESLATLDEHVQAGAGEMLIEDVEIAHAVKAAGGDTYMDLSPRSRVYALGDRYTSYGDMLRRIFRSDGFSRLYTQEATSFFNEE